MTNRTQDFLDLESPIGDLRLMASIACTMMEVFSQELQASGNMNEASVESVLKSIEQEFEAVMFCVYEVHKRAHDLERRYLAGPEVAA